MVGYLFIITICIAGLIYLYSVGKNTIFLFGLEPVGYMGLEVKMMRMDGVAKILSIGSVILSFWIILVCDIIMENEFIHCLFSHSERSYTDAFVYILMIIGMISLYGYGMGQKRFERLPRDESAIIPKSTAKSIFWHHVLYSLGFIAFGILSSIHFLCRAFI